MLGEGDGLKDPGTLLIDYISKLPDCSYLNLGYKDFYKTWQMARKCHSGGVCYIATMTRVNYIFEKYFGMPHIAKINFDSKHHIIHDTIYDLSATILSKSTVEHLDLLGYGVGGALYLQKVSEELLSFEEIKAGKLRKGAILQGWWAVQNREELLARLRNGLGASGHSFVFEKYVYSGKNLWGIECWDYHGYMKPKPFNYYSFILGANLKQRIL